MAHGTIVGLLLTDLIHSCDHAWSTLHDPSRMTVGALDTFAKTFSIWPHSMLIGSLPGTSRKMFSFPHLRRRGPPQSEEDRLLLR